MAEFLKIYMFLTTSLKDKATGYNGCFDSGLGLHTWPLPPDHRPEGGEFETRPCLQTVPLWSRCQEGPLLSVQVGAFEVIKEITFPFSTNMFFDIKKICIKSC